MITTDQLTQIRTEAYRFFTTPVACYSITQSYDIHGAPLNVSGLRFAVSGYVGKVSGKDQDMLESLGAIGTSKSIMTTVLVPYENVMQVQDRIRIDNQSWRVIWTNDPTSDQFQIYQKAICELEIPLQQTSFRGTR